MALPNSTTLSAAVGLNDTTVLLASITNVTLPGQFIRIDDEFMKVISIPAAATTPVPVLRGVDGTAQLAHKASAQVLLGAMPSNLVAGDWGQASPGAVSLSVGPRIRTRQVTNYAATGAITIPAPGTDGVAILDGTGALAMTLAIPSVLNDGDKLTIIGNGKSASTVTAAGGLGAAGAGYTVLTFQNAGQVSCELMAANGAWCLVGAPFTGTTTKVSIAIA